MIHYTILPLTIILSQANTIYIKNQDFIRKEEPRENEKKVKKIQKGERAVYFHKARISTNQKWDLTIITFCVGR